MLTLQAAASGQGGQHVLAAELLLFFAIVGVRAVAQYGGGKKDDLPADQYGPLYILGSGLAVFFVLSFLAARGGTWAKVAGAAGLLMDVSLLMKSASHLTLVFDQYAKPPDYTPVDESGSYRTADAAVLSPALQEELKSRALPPLPKGASIAKEMAYARKAIGRHGLKVSQFPDLVKLWNRESGWRPAAENASGAYGIPQALPASKMPKAAQPPQSEASAQIDWGLSYIKQTYGSIASAWAHEQHAGWY